MTLAAVSMRLMECRGALVGSRNTVVYLYRLHRLDLGDIAIDVVAVGVSGTDRLARLVAIHALEGSRQQDQPM